MRATFSAHIILLDMKSREMFGEEYKSSSSSIYSFPPLPQTSINSSLLDQIFSSAPYFRTPAGQCSYLNVRDQVLHPYKTSGKIIRLYIVIFVFWDSEWEDWHSARDASRHSPNLIFSSRFCARNFGLVLSCPNIRKFFTFSVFISCLHVVTLTGTILMRFSRTAS